MAYSTDARKLVLLYRDNGHTLEETYCEFKIAISTIRKWENLRDETGGLAKRELNRKPNVYPKEELRAYVSEHPDDFLKEIAEHFGGSVTGAFYALKREKITLKKKTVNMKNEVKKNEQNLIKN